ncbi:unnamed protein product (macronuclear) [Paramecium tetraurelia]|uniref:Uncharacterized protein n=1 Tax=Paramecium tetraurelia TaxID=5888 RepID=A0E5X1_PARTE|nr:uncharacterized protein GSPATT00003551001 [Paramecium tetraurelia]CAK90688.1 unnamed protein product [Paramecium tetraurelia]|eukprot:XP_001458085.1 hypothetical protein (macronuclear) [Paramecium tetraurelia strain d4-2]
MVKYQFTSQDVEQQANQLERLKEIIEKQARIIEKLENKNNDLRFQVEKLSLQLEEQQGKSQKDSDLLEIKEEKQDQDGSIIQQQKIENIFVQNTQSLFPARNELTPHQQSSFIPPYNEQTLHHQPINLFNQQPIKLNNIKEDSDISSKNQQFQDQFKVNDKFFREQKQSQSNDPSLNTSLIQNNNQDNNKNNDPFIVESKQDYNIFGYPTKNDQPQQQSSLFQINQPPQNQKEQMILEEVEEEQDEPLMFGDPSSIYYNNPLADKSKQNKEQEVEKVEEVEEAIKDLQINENQKANSQQNINDALSKSDGSAQLNQNGEDFQFEENNEQESI